MNYQGLQLLIFFFTMLPLQWLPNHLMAFPLPLGQHKVRPLRSAQLYRLLLTKVPMLLSVWFFCQSHGAYFHSYCYLPILVWHPYRYDLYTTHQYELGMSLLVFSQVWLESQLQEAGGEVLALNGTGPVPLT